MAENSIKYLNDLNDEIKDLEKQIMQLEEDIKNIQTKNEAKNRLINELVDDYILKED